MTASHLGEDAGVIGAALLARERLGAENQKNVKLAKKGLERLLIITRIIAVGKSGFPIP